ncbi:MAG: TlpA family protein disulfide reductase [Nitrospirae bacterium]|nr:MAG: TlpA family protein disulfide reductase [Nitrospirota bacterium]
MRKYIVLLFVVLFIPAITVAIPPAPWEIEELLGKDAPSFRLNDLNGNEVTLSAFQGKVVLINFWATWCGPCKREMPGLEEVFKRYKNQGFTVIAVSIDSEKSAILNFLKSIPLSFPILHDPKIEVSKRYKVYAYPTSFLIDRKGIIREKFIGEENWLDESRTKLIERFLNEKQSER